MDKKTKCDEAHLLPSYGNLDYDAESDNGPSAPGNDEVDPDLEGPRQLIQVPPTPNLDVETSPRHLTYNPPALVYEDIYEACVEYVLENSCYGSTFVKQMALTEINNGVAFHYILETFGEKRESMQSVTPFMGQFIDGPENGPVPGPWDIVVPPPALFQDGQARLEIPHTAYVKPCDQCVGNGRVRCENCLGMGGSSSSSGARRQRCYKCSGRGQVKCKRCDGHGNIKVCVVLMVTWTKHPSEFVSNTSRLPEKLVKQVTGSNVLSEEDERVVPIANFHEESVKAASSRLVSSHLRSFPNELILKQRQVLRAIPLTRASYQWKEKSGEFYVYGQEKKVYFEEYPQPCCCCTCL